MGTIKQFASEITCLQQLLKLKNIIVSPGLSHLHMADGDIPVLSPTSHIFLKIYSQNNAALLSFFVSLPRSVSPQLNRCSVTLCLLLFILFFNGLSYSISNSYLIYCWNAWTENLLCLNKISDVLNYQSHLNFRSPKATEFCNILWLEKVWKSIWSRDSTVI